MVPYEVYKIVHVVGIMMLFLTFGALLFAGFNKISLDKMKKRPWMIMHGVSLFLILLGGFGLLARLGVISGFPTWVWIKLVIWVYFGGFVVILIKKPKLSRLALFVALGVGLLAAYTAIYKPFL